MLCGQSNLFRSVLLATFFGLLNVLCLLWKCSEVFVPSSDSSLEVKNPSPMLNSQLNCILLDTWFVVNLTAYSLLSLTTGCDCPWGSCESHHSEMSSFSANFLSSHPPTHTKIIHVHIFHPVLRIHWNIG